MQLLFFVLNRSEMLDDILTSFADHDIHGATILDSKGMVHLWRLTATRARFRFSVR